MNKIVAVVQIILEEHSKLIQQIAEVIGASQIEVRKHPVDISEETILIIFGEHLEKHYVNIKNRVVLPEIEKLSKEYGNIEDRRLALSKLKEFKKEIHSIQSISSSFPNGVTISVGNNHKAADINIGNNELELIDKLIRLTNSEVVTVVPKLGKEFQQNTKKRTE